MAWNAARCSTWLKNYADEIASDAYRMGGDDVLYSCAGAAYYAVIHGVGYNTKDEFHQFIKLHLGWDEDFYQDAVSEIEK